LATHQVATMTPVKPSPSMPPRSTPWLWPFMLLLGSATLVVAWSSLALATGHQHGWVALLAALEAAWMLRLGGMAAGWPRRLLAAAATVAMALAVQWLVVSGHIGAQMGMAPWEAAPKMGAFYVWTLARLANGWPDLLCLGLAPLLALRAAR
jgi:hypothetical protein